MPEPVVTISIKAKNEALRPVIEDSKRALQEFGNETGNTSSKLEEMNQFLGSGSAIGQFGSLLRGGAAVAGLSLLASSISRVVEGFIELNSRARENSATFYDYAKLIGTNIPIVGGIVSSLWQLAEAASGATERIRHSAEITEQWNAALRDNKAAKAELALVGATDDEREIAAIKAKTNAALDLVDAEAQRSGGTADSGTVALIEDTERLRLEAVEGNRLIREAAELERERAADVDAVRAILSEVNHEMVKQKVTEEELLAIRLRGKGASLEEIKSGQRDLAETKRIKQEKADAEAASKAADDAASERQREQEDAAKSVADLFAQQAEEKEKLLHTEEELIRIKAEGLITDKAQLALFLQQEDELDAIRAQKDADAEAEKAASAAVNLAPATQDLRAAFSRIQEAAAGRQVDPIAAAALKEAETQTQTLGEMFKALTGPIAGPLGQLADKIIMGLNGTGSAAVLGR